MNGGYETSTAPIMLGFVLGSCDYKLILKEDGRGVKQLIFLIAGTAR